MISELIRFVLYFSVVLIWCVGVYTILVWLGMQSYRDKKPRNEGLNENEINKFSLDYIIINHNSIFYCKFFKFKSIML